MTRQCQLVQGLHDCQFVQCLHSNARLYKVYTAMPVCTRYTWQCQFVHFVQGLHGNAHVILQIVPAQQGTCFVSSMNGDTKKVSLQVLDNHQDASTCTPPFLPPPLHPSTVKMNSKGNNTFLLERTSSVMCSELPLHDECLAVS